MQDVEHPTTALGQFVIETEAFSGPLELLLALIEKRKLLINDISLASVTDDYMKHVALLEQCNIKETAQFVVLASTLLLIKSKSLLPVLSLTEEEEGSIEELQDRLRQYKIFKNASKTIEDIFCVSMNTERQHIAPTNPLFTTDTLTTTKSLNESIREVIAKLPKKVTQPKVRLQKVISLEEMIDKLQKRIEQQLKFRFTDFTGNTKERNTIVVGFLAVLEMVKQGSVMVRQTASFSEIEIEIEREPNQTPRYV